MKKKYFLALASVVVVVISIILVPKPRYSTHKKALSYSDFATPTTCVATSKPETESSFIIKNTTSNELLIDQANFVKPAFIVCIKEYDNSIVGTSDLLIGMVGNNTIQLNEVEESDNIKVFIYYDDGDSVFNVEKDHVALDSNGNPIVSVVKVKENENGGIIAPYGL
ncbi:hypothetical protein C4564_00180 [Candidatus Microgenomates bacterium]|nr:MAG: hypothetical protein C4564_00180 [Candidatus Microgenomates bacterium]